MWVISLDRDVIEGEVIDRADAGVQDESGEWAGLSTQLQPGLVEMVQIEMCVTESMDKVTHLQAANLSHHLRQQRIGGDVERNAQEDVRRALVQLTRQPALRNVELKHRMARRQCHVREIADIPRAHNVPAGIRNSLDGI